jgi:hypothetical protein
MKIEPGIYHGHVDIVNFGEPTFEKLDYYEYKFMGFTIKCYKENMEAIMYNKKGEEIDRTKISGWFKNSLSFSPAFKL